MTVLIVTSLFFIGVGIWQLIVPLDDLWRNHEKNLLARGLAPQRSVQWEKSARTTGWVLVTLGSAMLLMALGIRISTPPKMSGVSIDGRQLTQAEWDACNHKIETCLLMDAVREQNQR